MHPQYTTEFETAFSVSWPRVPWSRGSWRSESAAAHEALTALSQPDGRVHFAGDYMTEHEFVDAGSVRIGPRSRDSDPQSCAWADVGASNEEMYI